MECMHLNTFFSDSPCVHKVMVPPMAFGHTSQTQLLPWALVPVEACLYLATEQNKTRTHQLISLERPIDSLFWIKTFFFLLCYFKLLLYSTPFLFLCQVIRLFHLHSGFTPLLITQNLAAMLMKVLWCHYYYVISPMHCLYLIKQVIPHLQCGFFEF